MNWKLLAGLAFGAALLLGACSGNNASGTQGSQQPGSGDGTGGDGGNGDGTGGDGNGDGTGGDGNGDGTGGTTDPDPGSAAAATALTTAQTAYEAAQAAVATANAAVMAAEEGNTPALREAARTAIATANTRLAAAVTAAAAAVTAGEAGSDADLGRATTLRATITAYNTAQTTALETSGGSLNWYRSVLLRSSIPNAEVRIPSRDATKATIVRTPRRRATSATDSTVIDEPNRITATTFKEIPYAADKTVFSGSARHSADVFKVNGYTEGLASNRGQRGASAAHTGLQLTNAGLVIRFGRTDGEDYLDTQVKLGGDISADGTGGQDLTITFPEPQLVSATGGFTSWAGNGDFYWRSIVELDPSQREGGANHVSGAFLSGVPKGDQAIGTYEVWLSNHIGVDKGREPVVGSSAAPYPDDDRHLYLDYAAYGMFLFTGDDGINYSTSNRDSWWMPTKGRVQSISFGYTAFQDETGKKTAAIDKAITGGTFSGQAMMIAYRGDPQFGTTSVPYPRVATKTARGNVSLTVTINKSATDGSLIGSVSGIEEWDALNNRWKSGLTLVSTASGFASATVAGITLDDGSGAAVAVDADDGTFSGTAEATGTGTLASVLVDPDGGAFKGNFYGPRTDGAKLEAAGTFHIDNIPASGGNVDLWQIAGSFGAKQAQPAPAATE